MVAFIRSDLQFILEQIKIAERQAKGELLTDILPNVQVPFGLRTVDGSLNNLVQGNETFGEANNLFPRLLDPIFRDDQDGDSIIIGPPPAITNTNYGAPGDVVDADPRIISNLIVDQTAHNPAAQAAFDQTNGSQIVISNGVLGPRETFFIPNVAADAGLGAPFNAWMTFFGQFFDHGLDLVTKGGNGAIWIPLQPDDPLYNPATPQTNFMVLTRATNLPGPDNILGTADDIHEQQNTTSPFVDQNQTYSQAWPAATASTCRVSMQSTAEPTKRSSSSAMTLPSRWRASCARCTWAATPSSRPIPPAPPARSSKSA
jgi:Animal haem peroxidase